MQVLRRDESGLAHIALVASIIVVVAAVGFVGWRVIDKQSSESTDPATNSELKVDCDKINDDDLCKFFNNWRLSKQYRVTTSGAGEKAVFEVDNGKTHTTVTGGESEYELIMIEGTTYTKAGETWYKQPKHQQDSSDVYEQDDEFIEGLEEATDDVSYKKLGKEACGNLECFKYEITDKSNEGSKTIVWFDTKDYRLRKQVLEFNDETTEMTFDYDNVSVSEPSPVKELESNQYIVPGQTEPVTMPGM